MYALKRILSFQNTRSANVFILLILVLLVSSAGNIRGQNRNKEKPNILIFLSDDHTYTDAGCYGNDQVKTPHLNRLAREGMKFTRCFTATAMCAPTRQQLFTGIYPVRNGAYPNHSKVKKGTRSLFHYVRDRGYAVALLGKEHLGPDSSFPYQHLGGRQHDGGKGKALPLKNANTFVQKHGDQPWCLVIANNQPHRPWNRGDASDYNPETLHLPPYLVDHPKTRRHLARYYAEITYMDQQLGQVRRMLEKHNELNETLFLFTSEQGSNFPHCKWTLYDTGIRTMLIVRWPRHIEPGSTSDAMVEYVDIVPTLVDAIGGEPDSIDTGRPGGPDGGNGFDGASFLPVLRGEQDQHKKLVYGIQTTRGIFKGEAYPIRSVRTNRYKLILNLNHEEKFHNLVTEGWGLFDVWQKVGKTNDRAKRLVKTYQKRPEIEFYDLHKDPYELHNIADREKHTNRIQTLKNKINAWMKQQGDHGMKTEMKAPSRK